MTVPAPRWIKSTYSANNGNCVEVRATPAVTGVRDSKNADGPVLGFPTARWAAFLAVSRG
ncbi:DUF397 domain-containing protein [Actinosynnema sp. NPDC050436]|uniref:DUF397 domain-containing protein n=1 Tax=Actinosynnema sp. NPDC050436 TaxID=3155659 RepID=UPI0033C1743B